MAKGGNIVPSITNAEHIGPNDTGDNIEAKRVAMYGWSGESNGWQRMSIGLGIPAHDYIALSDYDGNNNPGTIVYKQGGSGGTTVATLTIAYSGINIISITRT